MQREEQGSGWHTDMQSERLVGAGGCRAVGGGCRAVVGTGEDLRLVVGEASHPINVHTVSVNLLCLSYLCSFAASEQATYVHVQGE